jgi:hypothetical protein
MIILNIHDFPNFIFIQYFPKVNVDQNIFNHHRDHFLKFLKS